MCEKTQVEDEPPEGKDGKDFDQSKRPSLARIMQMTRTRPRAKKAQGKK